MSIIGAVVMSYRTSRRCHRWQDPPLHWRALPLHNDRRDHL
jgi:hypothetical protein